jgi:hypothetical protein
LKGCSRRGKKKNSTPLSHRRPGASDRGGYAERDGKTTILCGSTRLSQRSSPGRLAYRVEIRPLLVATIQ